MGQSLELCRAGLHPLTDENKYIPTGKTKPACRACQRDRVRTSRARWGVTPHSPAPRPCAWCEREFTPKTRRTAKFCRSNCARDMRAHERRAPHAHALP